MSRSRPATLLLLTITCAPLVAQELPERPVVVAGEFGGELDDYLSRCERFGFSGAVLVERGGEVAVRKGYGLARPDEGVPNTPETLFDIASASKQVTAAAILLLDARGELALDASIGEYLPDVPERHAEVTVYHLLTHTSGFPRGGSTGGGPDLERALAGYLAEVRPRPAGERFEYYNGGYAMLAMIVERVSGEPFEDWVRANLFEPAGLLHTDFIETARVEPERIAISTDTEKPATDYIKGWGYRGMGGVLTSVADVGQWIRALHSGELLPEETLAKLVEPHLGQYACGWYVLETERGTRCIQHGGTSPGFQSYIRHFVDDEVLIVVLSNCMGMHWQIAWGLEALVFGGEPKVPPPPAVADWSEKDLERLCGTYDAKDGGRIVLRRVGKALEVCAEGQPAIDALDVQLGPPPPPGMRDDSAAQSAAEGFARERERAVAILEELLEGKVELLGADLLPHIPPTWPGVVRDRIWPAHLEEHGALEDFEEIGARHEAMTGRTRVWIRLYHERGEATLEVAFVGTSLNIFNLKAAPWPLRRAYAPAAEGDALVSYTFSSVEPPVIRLARGKGSRAKALVLDTPEGELEFRR